MFEYLMVCFDKTVGRDVTMVMMLHWFLQGDSDTSDDPQNRVSTSEEEVASDDPSEVGNKDDVERNEAVVPKLLFI